jgi:hypothetical protein
MKEYGWHKTTFLRPEIIRLVAKEAIDGPLQTLLLQEEVGESSEQ